MNLRAPSMLSLASFISIIVISSCSKKDDPTPLGAQTNATLLAGDKGKSKNWKLTGFTYQVGSGTAQTLTLDACFSDNVYTFSNTDAQSYSDAEGATKCDTSAPTTIETGTWSFTLDGKLLAVSVNSTFSVAGLFSPEAVLGSDSNGDPIAYNLGYPFPSTVKSLTASAMVLEMNETAGSSTYKFTFTFAAF